MKENQDSAAPAERRSNGPLALSRHRWRTNWRAEMRCRNSSASCRVVDVSSWGAQVHLDRSLGESRWVWLLVDGVSAIAAEVMWRSECRLGVRFLEERRWVLPIKEHQPTPAAS